MPQASEWNFIIAAYAITWVVLIGYAVLLAGKIRRAAHDVEDEIAEMERES
jgi:CcmD family protein